jgi:hypothetical protein
MKGVMNTSNIENLLDIPYYQHLNEHFVQESGLKLRKELLRLFLVDSLK